ncbi:hypothetical protein LIHA111178_05175 [Litorimonas haliclonae]
MSIGLPREKECVPDDIPPLLAKQILRALSKNNARMLEGLSITDNQRAVVKRARELLSLASRPHVCDFKYVQTKSSPTKGPLRILYVAHTSLIEHKNGYSVRTHEIVKSLARAGHNVRVVLRPTPEPGYDEELDGVEYGRHNLAIDVCGNWESYQNHYSKIIEKEAFDFKPDLIHAASNHITGYAAARAANSLNIPIIYEVRGFWEVTRLANHPKYEMSAGYEAQVNLESYIIRSVDHVLTLNGAMVDEVVRRGASRENVSLLPNCGDPNLFSTVTSSKPISEGPITFGYVGSFVQYEGLTLLIKAFLELCKKGENVRLYLAGHGSIEPLLRRAAKGPHEGMVHFHGAFSREGLEAIYNQIDVVVLPRRPNQVTRLVSALKPLEAFSAGLPAIFSDVRPLAELAEDSRGAICFEAGQIKDLTAKMRELIDDPDLRKQLGKNARNFIETDRNWDSHISRLIQTYHTVLRINDPAD